MEVVSINSRRKEQIQEEEQKKAMLEVVDLLGRLSIRAL